MKFEVEDMNGTFTTFTPSEGSRISFTGSGFAMLRPGRFAHTSVADMTLASHEYHAVIRYSIMESCFFGFPSKLVLIVNSLSSNDSLEFNIFLDQLPQGSGQAWQSRSTLQLFSDEVYNLTLTYNASDSSDNCSVLLDSLVFIPDVNITRVYTGSSEDLRISFRVVCEQKRLSHKRSPNQHSVRDWCFLSAQRFTMGPYVSSFIVM